jgi:hypothetical protein
MLFRLFILSILIFSNVTPSEARKPAVEDFVGIEVEPSTFIPEGNEALFDLEQDIHKIENQKRTMPKEQSLSHDTNGININTIIGIVVGLTLPIILWLMVMSHLKKKAYIETAQNIEILDKYRREREKKSQENNRKAS